MKKILFFLFVLVLGSKIYSQDTIVNYLDGKHKITDDKLKAKSIQKLVEKDTGWSRTIYWLNGLPKSQCNYKTKELKIKQGTCQEYDKEGRLRYADTYNKEGLRDGKVISYNKKGEKSFYGHYKDDNKEGLWTYHYQNGNKKARLVYKKGEVITYDLWTIEGVKRNEKLIFEQRPQYPGGMKKFKKRIAKELGPKFADFPLKGRVIASFFIGKTGAVEDLKITPTLPDQYQSILIGFFNDLPKWKPGIQLNNPVRVRYKLPIKF